MSSRLIVNSIRHTGASGDAVTLANDGTCTANITNRSNRNLIINGKADVFQRSLSGSEVTCNSGSNSYCMDRWYTRGESSLGVFKLIQQDISSDGQGAPHALKVSVTTNVTPGSGDVYKIAQRIEGKNIGHLSYGTSNAKTITLSFLVKSSVTGTHSGSLMNSAQNRSYPFTYTISSADTWEQKSITIPGDTGGTWVINTGIGLELNFDMGSGSGKRGSAGSWIGSRAEGATGAVQVISSANATWFITKVQIEVGSKATDFEHRSYGDELAKCQRYYYVLADGSAAADEYVGNGRAWSSTQPELTVRWSVVMRSAPSFVHPTGTNYYQWRNGSNEAYLDDLSFTNGTTRSAIIYKTGTSGLTAGGAYRVQLGNASAYLHFNAEL